MAKVFVFVHPVESKYVLITTQFDPTAAAMSRQASGNVQKFKPAMKYIEPAINMLSRRNKFEPFHESDFIFKLWKHNSGTTHATKMANHSLERTENIQKIMNVRYF